MANVPNSSVTRGRVGLRRSHVVWVSLLASMTLVGGLLLLSEDRRPGAALPPAVQLSGGSDGASIEDIFETSAPLDRERWQGIVIHHSGSVSGSPESLALEHRASGLRGLGYHFVLANGRGAPDGEIHVGYRWDRQLPGAHTVGPDQAFYNQRTVGICLVGDGERRRFTEAQMVRLVEVVAALQDRMGLTVDQVRLHRDVASTPGPGRLFPEAAFRARLAEARLR